MVMCLCAPFPLHARLSTQAACFNNGAVSAEKHQALEAAAQMTAQAAEERRAAAQQLMVARQKAAAHAQGLTASADARFKQATIALRKQMRDRYAAMAATQIVLLCGAFRCPGSLHVFHGGIRHTVHEVGL